MRKEKTDTKGAKTKKEKKGGRKIPLVAMLLIIGLVPLLLSVVTTLLVTLDELRTTVTEETTKRLKTIAYDTSHYFGVDWDNWMETGTYDGDFEFIDAHLDDDIVVTVFKGDTRYISSIRDANGERISGTKANSDIITAVLMAGGDYAAENVEINGEKYIVYYTPIRNTDGIGRIVGMAFCGEKMGNFEKEVNAVRNKLIVIAGACILFYAVFVILIAFKLKKPFTFLAKALQSLAAGNLDTNFNTSTVLVETSEMIESSGILSEELRNIVGSIKDETLSLHDNAGKLITIADSTNTNIESCHDAVNEIAQGAVESATDTDAIAGQCSELERISNNVSEAMVEMKKSADEALVISENAKQTMTTLESVSGETKDIVDDISGQMDAVNRRLADVGTIVTAIADITSQTNLLSLNASIEAARAGEAGRGFAVVAGEIRNLAESSADNANQINDIISGLVGEIKKTTELTDRLVTQSAEQIEQLNATGAELDKCIEEINLISGNVDKVNEHTQGLNSATHAVNEAAVNLSAVTEQNSASAEETTASMHESAEQVAKLNDNAHDVASISDKLKELVSFFKDKEA